MDWGSTGLTVLCTIIVELVLVILSPTFAEIGAKLHAKIWRKPHIKGKILKDLRILESIVSPLLFINQIPRYPDTYKEISNRLFDIHTKVHKVQNKKFRDIKNELIDYAAPMNRVNINTSYTEILDLFVKDGKAFKLVEEIREIISREIKEKKHSD
jgi:hypothetical protein